MPGTGPGLAQTTGDKALGPAPMETSALEAELTKRRKKGRIIVKTASARRETVWRAAVSGSNVLLRQVTLTVGLRQ